MTFIEISGEIETEVVHHFVDKMILMGRQHQVCVGVKQNVIVYAECEFLFGFAQECQKLKKIIRFSQQKLGIIATKDDMITDIVPLDTWCPRHIPPYVSWNRIRIDTIVSMYPVPIACGV